MVIPNKKYLFLLPLIFILGAAVAFYSYLVLYAMLALGLFFLLINAKMAVSKTFVFFLAFPLFLNIGGPGLISKGRSVFERVGGQTLPASLILLLLLVVVLVLHMLMRKQKIIINPAVKSFFVVFFICFIMSEIASFTSGNLFNFRLALQFFMPFLAYVVALNIIKDKESAENYIKILVIGGLLGGMAVLMANAKYLFTGQSFQDEVFSFNVYQIYDYYPLVLAIATSLAFSMIFITKGITKKLILASVFTLSLLTILHLNSRNAFLMVAFALILMVLFVKMNHIVRFLLFSSIIGASIFVFTSSLPVFYRFHAAGDSNETRFERLRDALNAVYHSPLFGNLYNPSMEIGAHNQYLEIASNGGLFVLVAFIAILISFIRRTIRFIRETDDQYLKWLGTTVLCIVVAVMLFSNIAQSNFTQPFSGLVLWFLIGCQDAITRTVKEPEVKSV